MFPKDNCNLEILETYFFNTNPFPCRRVTTWTLLVQFVWTGMDTSVLVFPVVVLFIKHRVVLVRWIKSLLHTKLGFFFFREYMGGYNKWTLISHWECLKRIPFFFLTKNKVCLFVKCSCIRQVFMAVAAGQQVVKWTKLEWPVVHQVWII